tara:strand:+ start:849 stop:1496 length:648 start_codon:yes stop_codon:yes gene_type:complete
MDKNLFIIDYETTGLNPYHHEVIEVAIKKYGSENNYSRLIKPTYDGYTYKYIPKKINEITGITDGDIETQGVEPGEAIYETLKYIEDNSVDGPIYLIAHNGVTFDFIFFRRALREYNKEGVKTRGKSINMEVVDRIRYIDTLLLSKVLIKDERLRQSNLCKRYGIKNIAEHRSLGDILALERIYTILCQQVSYLHKYDKDYYINNPEKVVDITLL